MDIKIKFGHYPVLSHVQFYYTVIGDRCCYAGGNAQLSPIYPAFHVMTHPSWLAKNEIRTREGGSNRSYASLTLSTSQSSELVERDPGYPKVCVDEVV
jgi:hypothetical protein